MSHALHQALKVLIPVFGRAEVSRQMPFKVTYLATEPLPRTASGGLRERLLRGQASEAVPRRQPGVDVDRWSGEVVGCFRRKAVASKDPEDSGAPP